MAAPSGLYLVASTLWASATRTVSLSCSLNQGDASLLIYSEASVAITHPIQVACPVSSPPTEELEDHILIRRWRVGQASQVEGREKGNQAAKEIRCVCGPGPLPQIVLDDSLSSHLSPPGLPVLEASSAILLFTWSFFRLRQTTRCSMRFFSAAEFSSEKA